MVPAQHWSRRTLCDSEARLWGGFVVEAGGYTLYFAGDSGYEAHFRAIAARFPRIDVALLPVGAFEPRWYMRRKHMSPEDAALAFRELRARWVVPIHWGTFRLGDEPMGEPPPRLLRALAGDARRCYPLPIGGVLRLPRLPPRRPPGAPPH
jgi:L-ascorbate metabolism protein UlaG (beta-lactamase superfamily)